MEDRRMERRKLKGALAIDLLICFYCFKPVLETVREEGSPETAGVLRERSGNPRKKREMFAATQAVLRAKMQPGKMYVDNNNVATESNVRVLFFFFIGYRSCKEVKLGKKTTENRDYFLMVKGKPAMVYCYKMDTNEPEEYVSLHADADNYAELYHKR